MASVNINVYNDIARCGIVLSSTATVTSISGISSVVISRKETSGSSWTNIQTIEVSSVSDLSFTCLDITVRSGHSYEYIVELISSSTSLPVEMITTDVVECRFYGLFIGDFEKQYVAGTNFKTETKKNTQVEYVRTLYGKFPYRVSNADTNYTTGTSTGLFLKLSDDKKRFIPDYNHSFSDEVIEFLVDGKSKILKTHDGQGWYVSIDANPSKVYSDFEGMNAISFNWTQMDELPLIGMVIE